MEAETKTGGEEDGGNENSSRVAENELPHDSAVVELLLEQFTQSVEQSASDQSASCLGQVESEFGKLISVQELLSKGSPDGDAGDSAQPVQTSAEDEKAELDENPRATHTQPFVAASAATQASWINCCGLLDVLRPSN